MDFQEALNYIDNTGSSGIKPGTGVIKELLGRLNNPEKGLNVIHVAGTNGKGSVCTYLECALGECGLKTGRYASPSVFRYLERIRLGGEDITEDDYAGAVSAVKAAAEEMEYKPTGFEAETAAAFKYFADKRADVIIVECGMGGLEDATNVFDSPLACVITSVSMDHMAYLGDDPEKIAVNKAGIIKENTPVIISRMPHISCKGKDYDPAGILERETTARGGICIRADEDIIPADFENPLPGAYQKDNLNAALYTLEAVKERLAGLFPDKSISSDIFLKGIAKASWPGRYERICDNPVIIRDGAHNPAAASALYDSLGRDGYLKEGVNIHLIMGVFKDKDYTEILRIMLPCAVSFTAIDLPDRRRGLPSDELVRAAVDVCSELGSSGRIAVSKAGSLSEALPRINSAEMSGPEISDAKELSVHDSVPKDVYVVFGSLSLMQLFNS
ncbi:MAG: bifunctional folylpolyglutamate synthase/dihydrofolate synthase [Lachnospiraceae bacterium]|nr:bifunctional folylpolyglutamate synthase/dihydrofolate synthase [Lachnospiraceae bacterium]